MAKKYNISKPEKYTKDGVEKTYWTTVGTLTEFQKQDGSISRIVEIPAIGLKANIFEQKEKIVPVVEKIETINYSEGEVDPNEIPF